MPPHRLLPLAGARLTCHPPATTAPESAVTYTQLPGVLKGAHGGCLPHSQAGSAPHGGNRRLHSVSSAGLGGGHGHTLTYHPGQRARWTGQPMYSKPTTNMRHTQITGGKRWLGRKWDKGMGGQRLCRRCIKTPRAESMAQPYSPSPRGGWHPAALQAHAGLL